MAKVGSIDVFDLSGPEVLAIAAFEQVKIGGQIVPEIGVIGIIHRTRPTVAIDLPVGTPVAACRDILDEVAQHVARDVGQTENLRPGTLVRDVAHAKGFSTRQRGFVPVAHRIAPENVGKCLLPGPGKTLHQRPIRRA